MLGHILKKNLIISRKGHLNSLILGTNIIGPTYKTSLVNFNNDRIHLHSLIIIFTHKTFRNPQDVQCLKYIQIKYKATVTVPTRGVVYNAVN